MNTPIIIANALTFLAFLAHTFIGDRELNLIAPAPESDPKHLLLEKWTMARGGWHWVSFDLLFASIGLGLINFTDYVQNHEFLLRLLAIYFLGYGAVWLLVIIISKRFPKNYFKLGQWMLLWLIGGLLFLGLS